MENEKLSHSSAQNRVFFFLAWVENMKSSVSKIGRKKNLITAFVSRSADQTATFFEEISRESNRIGAEI